MRLLVKTPATTVNANQRISGYRIADENTSNIVEMLISEFAAMGLLVKTLATAVKC